MRSWIALTLIAILMTGCQGISPKVTPVVTGQPPVFETVDSTQLPQHSVEGLKQGESGVYLMSGGEYRIGPGDVLDLRVWQYPDLSVNEILVGPDGMITIPRVGPVAVSDMTREEASNAIAGELLKIYADITTTLTVRVYRNNRAYVLGAVTAPGVVYFAGPGTLIEAITLAGGPVDKTQPLAGVEAAIVRGKNQIVWVDLGDLLTMGNTSINLPIHTNDVVYVPPMRMAMVYVMGEVHTPRAVPLTGSLNYLDAIMLAGGPTPGASIQRTFLIRWTNGQGSVTEIDMTDATNKGDLSKNYLLKDKDIVYVSMTGLEKLNTFIDQITPTLRAINLVNDLRTSSINGSSTTTITH